MVHLLSWATPALDGRIPTTQAVSTHVNNCLEMGSHLLWLKSGPTTSIKFIIVASTFVTITATPITFYDLSELTSMWSIGRSYQCSYGELSHWWREIPLAFANQFINRKSSKGALIANSPEQFFIVFNQQNQKIKKNDTFFSPCKSSGTYYLFWKYFLGYLLSILFIPVEFVLIAINVLT